jgi:glucose/mannose transport system substrate-binding protein
MAKIKPWGRKLAVGSSALALALAAACGGGAADNGAGASGGDVEVFTWWTSGSEAAGLQGLSDTFTRDCAGNTFVNAAIAGGSGSNSKQVLASRLQQNDPPSTFQIHAGAEATDYISAGQVEDLSKQYQDWGLTQVFPKGLLDSLTQDGKIYSVPANIHRIMLWSNTDVLKKAGVTAAPKTTDELVANLDKLRAAGVTSPLGVGVDWTQTELVEAVLLADLGPERFTALWKKGADWSGADITKSLQTYQKLLGYSNPDRDSLDWTDVEKRLTGGSAAYQLMGDWQIGEMEGQNFKSYAYQAFPGTEGSYQWLADAFVLPVGAKNVTGAECWLKTVGSADGQKAFNTKKGSIPARIDANPADYPEYQQKAIAEFKDLTLVPSCAHGSACTLAEGSAVNSAIGRFSTSPDVAALQNGLGAAVTSNGPGTT